MSLAPGPYLKADIRVKLVAERAYKAVIVNPKRDVRIYVMSGKQVLKQAANFQKEDKIEDAYTLYTRYLTLIGEKIITHPGYKDLPKSEKKLMNTFCINVLQLVEGIKEQLLQKFEKEHNKFLRDVEILTKRYEESSPKKEKVNWKSAGESHSEGDGAKNKPSAASVKILKISSTSESNSESNSESSETQKSTIGPPRVQDHKDQGNKGEENISPRLGKNTKGSRLLPRKAGELRPVVIPGDLVSMFLKLADANSKLHLDTFGHLLGHIVDDRIIFVTDLVIAKSKETSDLITNENERAFKKIQDKRDLVILGWIHTHPNRTEFLSAQDLHKHLTHQSTIPESIVIVCAPSRNKVLIYSMTPFGMDVVKNCRYKEFHMHPSSQLPLAKEATHTVVDECKEVVVHNLQRTKNT